ncbi:MULTISPECIES: hypothetical protein [Saccharothrix]|uniref:hypothetical protein n=1 Tax=Saccharothrix TaxID=2071 RepID=UPI000963E75C|nr:hypothetical protein [Saccharothrix sp. CB00851]OKI32574.1 hypothetical protein A6A25_25995 [Saccharothrix sp. CB00851]
MADSFQDADLAAYYDLINGFGDDDRFYLALVMAADAVLDVGCGTGTLLKAARAGGHTGRLVGLDPATGAPCGSRRRTRSTRCCATPGSRWPSATASGTAHR